jgi:hypothetical protein
MEEVHAQLTPQSNLLLGVVGHENSCESTFNDFVERFGGELAAIVAVVALSASGD